MNYYYRVEVHVGFIINLLKYPWNNSSAYLHKNIYVNI